MVDKIVSIFTTALLVAALGIALRPNAPTAKVLTALFSGFGNVVRSTYGPA